MTATEDSTLNFFQVSCAAIAVYNSGEVLALTFSLFSKYNTLYFRSIVACAIGIILFTGGFLDLFYDMYLRDGVTMYRPLIILTIGWYGMVTGFALVMYSRLHLIQVPKKYIRYMKFFIIYNVIFSHFPTTVLTFGANLVATPEWKEGYRVMEKLQMTMFCIQEVALGALYLHYTRKMTFTKKTTPLVKQTMYINIVVLALDISMLLVEYIDLYEYQIMLKCVVYSVKLKLEFYILNLLSRSLVHNSSHGADSPKGPTGHFSSHLGGGDISSKVVSPLTVRPDVENAQSTSDSSKGRDGEA